MEEEYGQDGAQEEEREEKKVKHAAKSVIVPDRPADVPNYTDCHVDPSELLTEHDT